MKLIAKCTTVNQWKSQITPWILIAFSGELVINYTFLDTFIRSSAVRSSAALFPFIHVIYFNLFHVLELCCTLINSLIDLVVYLSQLSTPPHPDSANVQLIQPGWIHMLRRKATIWIFIVKFKCSFSKGLVKFSLCVCVCVILLVTKLISDVNLSLFSGRVSNIFEIWTSDCFFPSFLQRRRKQETCQV